MKKSIIILSILLVLGLIIAGAGCVSTSSQTNALASSAVVSNENNSGLAITNSDGTVTHLKKTPERIILLNSNAGEIMYLLGDAGKIVGISQSIANNAEQAKMYPNAKVIGAWNEPNVELLVNLNADLVIGYATSKPKNAEVLAAAGIPIVYIDCTKPNTMASDIVEMGKISGSPEKAKEIAEFYTQTMNKIKAAADPLNIQKSVYAESYTDYWAQGTDSGLGQLITLAEGSNIMPKTGSEKISGEWVVSSNPEVVVKLVNSMDNAEGIYKDLISRTGYDTISAYKNNASWLIRNDLTYGPRSCAAAAALFEMMYPKVAHDFSAKLILEEFNAKFGTNFETGNITWPELK